MVAAEGAGGNGPMDRGCMWVGCCSRDTAGGGPRGPGLTFGDWVIMMVEGQRTSRLGDRLGSRPGGRPGGELEGRPEGQAGWQVPDKESDPVIRGRRARVRVPAPAPRALR